jgi:hypothetical protein
LQLLYVDESEPALKMNSSKAGIRLYVLSKKDMNHPDNLSTTKYIPLACPRLCLRLLMIDATKRVAPILIGCRNNFYYNIDLPPPQLAEWMSIATDQTHHSDSATFDAGGKLNQANSAFCRSIGKSTSAGRLPSK